MLDRSALHASFEEIVGESSVYFQPPASVHLTYPCIIYHRSEIKSEVANNKPYKLDHIFMVTLIYKDPDSVLPQKVAALPGVRFLRSFTVVNLFHNIFTAG